MDRRPLRTLTSLARLALLFLLAAAQPLLAAAQQLTLIPGDLVLQGPRAAHRLLVQRVQGEDVGVQVREELEFTTSNPEVAVVRDGIVLPRGNGQATIEARVGDQTVSCQVQVQGFEIERPRSFRHDIEPVLAKVGCNSGACHGALAGKGGFKLTLRGYDPTIDYFNITRQSRGRRIELSDPGRSLILAKPSGGLPHKGGVRFSTDSEEYQRFAEWLAAGAPGPQDDDPQVVGLEVLPRQTTLAPGNLQQMLVRAHFSDGRIEDVTRYAMFASANEAVATVNEQGEAQVVGSGEGAITAWFASRIVIARITVPYPHQIPPEVYASAPQHNFIDAHVVRQLQRLRLAPSPPASDEEFLRRAYLDTIGTLPTAEEVRAFLEDTRPDRRNRVIEVLLSRPEFVDYWTYKWSDVLLVNGQLLRPNAVKAYYQWIRQEVEANRPWDEFVRSILTAQGSSFENGATNFYALHQDPESMTENACQAFLGLSIGCAKCHNHPLEKWTNNQYYAMANLFSRVRAKGWGGDSRNGDGQRTVYAATTGELIQPLTGKPQPPTPLDGEPLPFEATADRREYLADWLTSPENPYFARAITNRVWANFFGVGLVESVDDLRASNPASNEELLTAAAQYLVEQDFDLKSLMRVILQSAAYQRSSLDVPENQDEQRFYSRYYPRRLMAEVLLDAISQATGVVTEFNEVAYPGADRQKTDFYPKGTRAIQLYDSAVASYFLETFGRNQRMITCECERSNEPSLVQVLHLSNGDTINRKLKAEDNRISKWLTAGLSPAQIVDEAYLVTLSRLPRDEEKSQLVAILDAAPESERRIVLEDLMWSILSSREFLFQH